MATTDKPAEISKPFPIFQLANRYLLYDVDVVSYVRREHHICGVFVGGLPQASQQNVFLGLPLQLMPEEVRLLVEAGVAYVADDVKAHKRDFLSNGLGVEERRAYQSALRKQGLGAAKDASKRADERKKAALESKKGASTDNWNDIPEDMLMPTAGGSRASRRKGDKRSPRSRSRAEAGAGASGEAAADESLFASPANDMSHNSEPTPPLPTAPSISESEPEPWAVTPTTSTPPIHVSSADAMSVPDATKSYPLFKHLHEKGYFMSPGLRFGCQYMAYPGDPLRFHSHFLCRGMEWDEEFDLLDLVGGGRLGTGVKKGFLVGGEETHSKLDVDGNSQSNGTSTDHPVRTFCVEWGGM